MDHVGQVAAAGHVQQIEEQEESRVPGPPFGEQTVPEPERQRDPLGDEDLDVVEVLQPERRKGEHPAGQQGCEPGPAAALAHHPRGRQGARHERGEEEDVVAGDGVRHDLQESRELEGRPEQVVRESEGAAGGPEDVGVPEVRQAQPYLMDAPFEHPEVEDRVLGHRRDVVPPDPPDGAEVDQGEQRGRGKAGQGREPHPPPRRGDLLPLHDGGEYPSAAS